jgi:hypothetical protein
MEEEFENSKGAIIRTDNTTANRKGAKQQTYHDKQNKTITQQTNMITKIVSNFDSVYNVSYFWQIGYFNSVSVNN